jgi:predicted dehydrogenase
VGNNGKRRVAVVGCGDMSRVWLEAALAIDGVELVALVDLNVDSARRMAARFQLPDAIVYDDLDKALSQAKPDLVFDVTVPAAHHDVAIAAMRAGCDVLGEKPLADTMARARAVVEAARQTGRVFAVMQNRRCDPHIRAIQRFLADGGIGTVAEIHSDFFIGAHFGGFRQTMKHPLLLDMAIHTFDAARMLSGADPLRVMCHSFNPAHSWYEHDASAAAIFQMTDGIVFTYRGSWCGDGLATAWEAAWRIVGSRGTLTWDGAAGIRVERFDDDADRRGLIHRGRSVAVPVVDLAHSGHAGMIREYLAALDHGEEPATAGRDNIKSLAMALGAVASAEAGGAVDISDLG